MTSDDFEMTADIEIDGLYGDKQMHFNVECDTYPAEPYSWGGSRGTETSVTATFFMFMLGRKMVKRTDLVEMIGEAEVQALEGRAAEAYAEQVRAAA